MEMLEIRVANHFAKQGMADLFSLDQQSNIGMYGLLKLITKVFLHGIKLLEEISMIEVSMLNKQLIMDMSSLATLNLLLKMEELSGLLN